MVEGQLNEPGEVGSRPETGPSRVLLVLDQPVLAELVRLALNHGRFLIRVAQEWADVAQLGAEWRPHLALVDMDLDGGSVLARLMRATMRVPVIALTRRADLQTKLAAFDSGVEDVITVPFSPEELVARTLVVMRRVHRRAVEFTPVIRLGDLEIDILHRSARAGDSELHLTSVEQSLLYLLAANPGRLMTRDEILDNLWGLDYASESNLVDRHIRNLRAKLRDDWRRPRFIATVPGQGYRFLVGEAADPPP